MRALTAKEPSVADHALPLARAINRFMFAWNPLHLRDTIEELELQVVTLNNSSDLLFEEIHDLNAINAAFLHENTLLQEKTFPTVPALQAEFSEAMGDTAHVITRTVRFPELNYTVDKATAILLDTPSGRARLAKDFADKAYAAVFDAVLSGLPDLTPKKAPALSLHDRLAALSRHA